MAGPAKKTAQVIRHLVFESLFDRALCPSSEMKAKLRIAGYDMDNSAESYPLSVFGACLDVAQSEVSASEQGAASYSVLGHKFVDGAMSTVQGKIIAGMLFIAGPAAALRRVPDLVGFDYGIILKLETLSPLHVRFTSQGGLPPWTGPYFRGLFGNIVRHARGTPTEMTLSEGVEAGSFVADVMWTPGRDKN